MSSSRNTKLCGVENVRSIFTKGFYFKKSVGLTIFADLYQPMLLILGPRVDFLLQNMDH